MNILLKPQKITGLSLIEILIVFVIIGIVCTLGVQGLLRLRDDTRVSTVKARIKQLDIAKEQYIAEWGRIEATQNWSNMYRNPPSGSYIPGQMQDGPEACYNVLKRYIERPQGRLHNDVAPDQGCTIGTPATVLGRYYGVVTLDSAYTLGSVKISKIAVTDH
jgi:type II secretory pathway pseudopilin PulG